MEIIKVESYCVNFVPRRRRIETPADHAAGHAGHQRLPSGESGARTGPGERRI